MKNEVKELRDQLKKSNEQYVESQSQSRQLNQQLTDEIDQLRITQKEAEKEQEEVVKQFQDRLSSVVANRDATVDMSKERFNEQCRQLEEQYRQGRAESDNEARNNRMTTATTSDYFRCDDLPQSDTSNRISNEQRGRMFGQSGNNRRDTRNHWNSYSFQDN